MSRALQLGVLVLLGWMAVPDEIDFKAVRLSPARSVVASDAELGDAESYLRAQTDRGHLLIQLHDRSARVILEGQGVRFLRLRNGSEWLVSAPRTLFERESARRMIATAAPLRPFDRVHPYLAEGSVSDASTAPDGRWRLRVLLADDADVAAAATAFEAEGIEVRTTSTLPPAMVVLADPGDVDVLSSRDDVLWVREIGPGFENANDENRVLTRVNELQTEGLSGTGIVVGVWDSGVIDDTHPDLTGRVTLADSTLSSNHGTMVAGTVGGDGTQSIAEGGTDLQWRGMAPGVSFVTWDYFTAADSLPVEEIGPGIVRFGLDLANHSYTLGVNGAFGNCDVYGDYDFDAPEYDLLLEPGAHDSVLVVFAAGNERDDGDCGLAGEPYINYSTIPPPSTAKNIFTVGAVEADIDSMTSFSSWGPTDDGRLKPDICAPGSQRSVDFGVTSTRKGGDYGTLAGTSFATPTVTGAAALLSGLYQDSLGTRPHPNLLKALMINGARDKGRLGPDYRYGHGVMDIAESVANLRRGEYFVGSISDLETIDIPLFLPFGPDSIQVSIVWNDPAAMPLDTLTLVNDLDIQLIAPDLTPHSAWVLNPDNPDTSATRGANTRDVIEQVRVSDPDFGTWTIRVTGTDVPMGPQPFALAWRAIDGPCQGDRIFVPFEHATIQEALLASGLCDTIVVNTGTYVGPFEVTKPVAIFGALLGGPITLTAPDSVRIMEVSADARLQNLLFEGGTLTAMVDDTTRWVAPDSLGAALYAHDATIEVLGCSFKNNASARGGAIWLKNAVATFQDCEIDSNTAIYEGGAVYADSLASAIYDGGRFSDNVSDSTGGAIHTISSTSIVANQTSFLRNLSASDGGAIFAGAASAVVVDGGDFTRNVAVGRGGGVYAMNASVAVDSVSFFRNEGVRGGAAWVRGAGLRFERCDFDSNLTGSEGGALYLDTTTGVAVIGSNFTGNSCITSGGAVYADTTTIVSLLTSNFTGNVAPQEGGALYARDVSLAAVGTTFDGNDADRGGAVWLRVLDGSFESCVFDSNSAAGPGGAVFADSSSTVNLTDCTLVNNVSPVDGGAVYGRDVSVTAAGTTFDGNDADRGGAVWLRTTDSSFESCAFDSNSTTGVGGAIFADSSSVFGLTDCTMAGNLSPTQGGAVYARDVTITAVTTAFDGNGANEGGAIWLRDLASSFQGCDFDSNSTAGHGGAIFADSTTVLELTDCTLVGNQSQVEGAAIYADSTASLNVTGSLFDGNVSLLDGGAVYLRDATITAETTRFTANGGVRGAAIWLRGSPSTFTACDFDSNASASHGGALYADSTSTVIVTDGLFHHNTTSLNGGAIFARKSTLSLERVTLADNAADSTGGAVYVDEGDSLFVRSTIVAGNTAAGADTVDGIWCSGPTVIECVVFWNQEQDSLNCPDGTDVVIVDPLFCNEQYFLALDSPAAPENSPPGCGRIGAREATGCVVVGFDGEVATVPRFLLGAARPNPTPGAARIQFEVPSRERVRLYVFDVGGRRVARLIDATIDAGAHTIVWDGRDRTGRLVSPGVYFYRLESGSQRTSRKLVILR